MHSKIKWLSCVKRFGGKIRATRAARFVTEFYWVNLMLRSIVYDLGLRMLHTLGKYSPIQGNFRKFEYCGGLEIEKVGSRVSTRDTISCASTNFRIFRSSPTNVHLSCSSNQTRITENIHFEVINFSNSF